MKYDSENYVPVDIRDQQARFPRQHLEHYLQRVTQTVEMAVSDHPKTLAIRLDLHLYPGFERRGRSPITLFLESLKAQISHDLERKRASSPGRKVHPCRVRSIWCREQESSTVPHYHIFLFLNANAYRTLGLRDAEEGNMAARIKRAWATALRLPVDEASPLVHFPPNPEYLLLRDSYGEIIAKADFTQRVTYLAKIRTKEWGTGERSFGYSLG